MAEIQWPPCRNVNLSKGFAQESSGPASEHQTGPIPAHPNAGWLLREDAINLKPQERKEMHFLKAAS